MKKIIAVAIALVLALSVTLSVSATALNAKSETPVVKPLSGEDSGIGDIIGGIGDKIKIGDIFGSIDLDGILGSLGGGDFDITKVIDFIKNLLGSGEDPTKPSDDSTDEDPTDEDPTDEPSSDDEPTDEPSSDDIPDTGDIR